MAIETAEKESRLARRMFTQAALYYRAKGDRVRMLIELNLARLEVMNQRYFLGEPPF